MDKQLIEIFADIRDQLMAISNELRDIKKSLAPSIGHQTDGYWKTWDEMTETEKLKFPEWR